MRDTNNWIPNVSGECPVAEGTLIDVMYRDGVIKYKVPALTGIDGRDATSGFWVLEDEENDLIAWRPHQEETYALPLKTENVNTSDVNPKQSIGLSKLPLHLWSPLATAYGTLGLTNGREKYGQGNYKATDVILSIYIAATMRHLLAFLEGQECDPVDGVPHIAAILANMAIILDARAVGTLVDDRPIQGGYLKELDNLTKIYQAVVKLHEGKNPKHYTINDNPEGAIK